MPLIIGVDSSTQSTKVEVRDADNGKLIATGRAPHLSTNPPRSEQDPESWWAALRSAIAAAGKFDVAAISVAGQQHGMVALDRGGQVIRPAKLWNDTESAPEAAALTEALGPTRWAQATGSVPVASFTVSKLAWLKAHEPRNFSACAHVLLPHDWLNFRLTEAFVTDRGDASGTCYWSPAEGRYRLDLLQFIDRDKSWADMLPSVLAPFEPAGECTPAAIDALGITSRRVLVAPGTGDNMAAALGTGLHVGDVAISLGTSGTVYCASERATADPSGLVAGFADACGRFLPLVCTLNAMKVTDTFARLMGVDLAEFDRLALEAPAAVDGLVLVPYLDGERTPNLPFASGQLVGLRSGVTRAQIARAAVEGVVCGLLDGFEALSQAGVDLNRSKVFVVGGGTRSEAYRRVIADLLERPITVPAEPEHVAAGACVQAAAVVHRVSPEKVAESWGFGAGTVVEPDPNVDSLAIRAAYLKAAREAARQLKD